MAFAWVPAGVADMILRTPREIRLDTVGFVLTRTSSVTRQEATVSNFPAKEMKGIPSPPAFRPPHGAEGFTLVETLAVTGIILILTTITAMAVRGFNGSLSRRAAVGDLMGVLDQARTVAISDGRPTYVVFASAAAGGAQATGAPADFQWGRAYALFEDREITDGMSAADFPPEQRSAWMYLPTGVAFKCDSRRDGTPPSLTASLPAADDPTMFPVRSAALSLPYLKFDAAGQIVDCHGDLVDAGSPCLRVLLFEGSATGTGVETATQRTAENPVDGKKYTLDEILLRATTGRAQYTLDPLNNGAGSAPATP